MGEGLYVDSDGETVFAEPCDGIDPEDDLERERAWRDFIETARSALTDRWRRVGSMWRRNAAVLARSGLHLLTLYEDSYSRGHLTVAVRSDLDPRREALARAQLDGAAERVFVQVARRYPLHRRRCAWTSAPWTPRGARS